MSFLESFQRLKERILSALRPVNAASVLEQRAFVSHCVPLIFYEEDSIVEHEHDWQEAPEEQERILIAQQWDGELVIRER